MAAYVPRVSSTCLPPLQETLQGQQVGLTHMPSESLLLPWVLEGVSCCVLPLRVDSPFFTALWVSPKWALLDFKVKCSGGLFSWRRTSRLGSLWHGDWTLYPLGRTSAIVIILSFVGPGDMSLVYNMPLPFQPMWLLLYILTCKRAFLLVFCSFLSIVAL